MMSPQTNKKVMKTQQYMVIKYLFFDKKLILTLKCQLIEAKITFVLNFSCDEAACLRALKLLAAVTQGLISLVLPV